MSNEDTLKDTFIGVFGTQVDAAKMGFSMAGADEAQDLLVDTLHEILPISIPEWARIGWIREYAEPLAISSGLLLACRVWPNRVPKADLLERLAYLASVAKWEEVSRPLFKYLRRFGNRLIEKIKGSGLAHLLDEDGTVAAKGVADDEAL